MKKTISAFILLYLITAYSALYAQKEEKITVTTYYPSPSGVYQTIRLYPGDTPPTDARYGNIFYNNTTDRIQYYNNSGKWVNISGTAVSNGTEHVDPISFFPGCATAGDIYFNNITNQILYYNQENKWVSIGGVGYWTQGALVPLVINDSAAYYPRYLVNGTMRRVGIGTDSPKAPFSVYLAENSGSNENVTIANFTRVFNSTGKLQSLAILLYPNGTRTPAYPSYLDSTSLISVPEGRLHVTATNPGMKMSFNVGGYDSSATEVMTLSNPCMEDYDCQRVGIGNSSSPFALFVDSKDDNTTAFGMRAIRLGVKSAISTITPYNDSVWITLGFYLKNGTWRHQEHSYIPPGNWSRQGLALTIRPAEGVFLYSYNASNLTNNNTTVAGWRSSWKLWNTTGVHTDPSSRALKENFAPLDREDFLRRIDQMEVTRWNFKGQSLSETHVGPVAEDFKRIFELGSGDGSITLIDTAGVSLAGVKALSVKIKSQQKRIKELESELEYLEALLSRRRQGGL